MKSECCFDTETKLQIYLIAKGVRKFGWTSSSTPKTINNTFSEPSPNTKAYKSYVVDYISFNIDERYHYIFYRKGFLDDAVAFMRWAKNKDPDMLKERNYRIGKFLGYPEEICGKYESKE